MTATAGSIRAQNRERITAAILASSRAQIAERGANELSLRAIARELQMASSAIYRYFPSRDALLTTLIIDSYNSIADQVEEAEAVVPRADFLGRYRAICRAARTWSLANRHEFFLIYGTPVPGYAAPTDTIEPASRIGTLLIGLMLEAAPESSGERSHLSVAANAASEMALALAPIRRQMPPDISEAGLLRGLGTFSAMFGAISFELSGQLHNVVDDSVAARAAYYDALIEIWLETLGW
ncbi:MAG: TetR/AcrR family transcriptional regulator [Actinobacteria bacterium]|nr:TetR/AcrR family transcriptional regulator [Actinomycetota bacterium]